MLLTDGAGKEPVSRRKTKCVYQCRSLKDFRAEFLSKCAFTTRNSSSNSNSSFRVSTPAAPMWAWMTLSSDK